MNVDIQIPGADSQGHVFLAWAPVQATAALRDGPAAGPVAVTLRNKPPASAGQVKFATTRTHNGTPTLALNLPAGGTPVPFFVAGEFQHPSAQPDDAVIEAVGSPGADILGSKAVMVRIRKSAQNLSPSERDRFLAAFGTLNGQGAGRFGDFRDMHVRKALGESHGNVGFLPWHRAYLLDLERELQAIDPSVALPYWRFDKPAPNIFTREFLGEENEAGRAEFTPGHPLEHWSTDGETGIVRSLTFPASSAPPGLFTEAVTLNLGGSGSGKAYRGFKEMEDNPHGDAHTAFDGPVSDPATSPRDPLFFLLHTNVDRLWAKWQWVSPKRHDPADPKAYAAPSPNRIGHRLGDTMWPWNGLTAAPRPSTAPGGTLASSPLTAAPGPSPMVRAMFDYQGVLGGDHLGFSYDDIPFEIPAGAQV
jgi:tyrosinase